MVHVPGVGLSVLVSDGRGLGRLGSWKLRMVATRANAGFLEGLGVGALVGGNVGTGGRANGANVESLEGSEVGALVCGIVGTGVGKVVTFPT